MSPKQIEPYISTYMHKKGRSLGLPIAGNFELTARCNFDCPMCYVHKHGADAAGELTAAQWLQIAREARDAGMLFALLTGGEPFVRKDFFEILHGMQDLGLHVSVNSNGSMLKGPVLEALLERPPARMNISLYGGSEETYLRQCGLDAFHDVVENISALRKAGVTVGINLAITAHNRQDVKKIYELSKEMGIPVRAGSYMYPSVRINGGRFGYGDRLSPEEAARCEAQWDQLRMNPEEFSQRAKAMEHFCADRMGCPVEAEEGVQCRAGFTSFWMTWDGRMLPCGMMPHAGEPVLEKGFAVAWQAVREWTAAIRMPKECGTCAYKPMCPVCAAVTITETGRFDGVPEYVCRQTKATIEETIRLAGERSDPPGD